MLLLYQTHIYSSYVFSYLVLQLLVNKLLCRCYKWWHWGSERLGNLLKIIQLVIGTTRIKLWSAHSKGHVSSHCIFFLFTRSQKCPMWTIQCDHIVRLVNCVPCKWPIKTAEESWQVFLSLYNSLFLPIPGKGEVFFSQPCTIRLTCFPQLEILTFLILAHFW